jgi:hypothetical protein
MAKGRKNVCLKQELAFWKYDDLRRSPVEITTLFDISVSEKIPFCCG